MAEQETIIPSEAIEIFVLDDDESFCEIVLYKLKAGGIMNKITTFTEPHKMIASLHDNVRLCIVDFILGSDLNGLDVIKKVVEKVPLCLFIMLSGQDDKHVVAEFVNSIRNAGKYIEKDIEGVDHLVEYVNELIDNIHIAYVMYTTMEKAKSVIGTMKNILDNDRDTSGDDN